MYQCTSVRAFHLLLVFLNYAAVLFVISAIANPHNLKRSIS